MANLEVKFNKGLNSKIDFLTNAPGHCLTFSDYQLDYGILKPRTAMAIVNQSVIGSSSNVIDGLGFWVSPTQAATANMIGNLYINDSTGGKFYRSSVYAQTSNGSVTVTDITNSVTQNSAPITFASLNGILVFTGTGGHVNQVTSSTSNVTALAGVSANFRMVRTVNNFMFGAVGAAGAGSTNSTLYWCAAGDPTTWPAGSNLTFRNNDGDSIQALGELGSNVLIFKQLSIGQLSTTTTSVSGTVTLAPLTTIFQGIGCAGPCAVDNLPDGTCIFIGTDSNVYRTDGSSLISLTNNPPNGINVVDAILSSGQFGAQTYLRYHPQRNEIVVSGINSATSPFCFAYDIYQEYWRKITGISPYSLCIIKNPGINQVFSLVLAGNNLGNVIDVMRNNNATPTNQDGTTATPDVSASVVIPENFFNGSLAFLTIIYKAANAVSYRYGFDNTYGSSKTLPTSSTRQVININLSGTVNAQRPTSFQINFQDNGNGVGAGATIYSVTLSNEANN